ncbi:MFS transporter, partial [Nocardioides salarius]|uniref:MFS transporter n=1 Tax=Nocardioides salarius TaxID=374513 RepID=UPI0030FCF99E
TGLVLVLSVHLQTEMGLAPLTAGLLLTGFALGSADSAPLAGRVVTTVGRQLSVGALVTVVGAVVAMAVLVPGREGGALWALLPPLLFVGGLGGGAVISPNFTLTLDQVPPRMGGAAGGALQTGQRIGSAVGSALGVTAYTVALGLWGPEAGLRTAFLTSAALVALALVAAVVALRDERAGREA